MDINTCGCLFKYLFCKHYFEFANTTSRSHVHLSRSNETEGSGVANAKVCTWRLNYGDRRIRVR